MIFTPSYATDCPFFDLRDFHVSSQLMINPSITTWRWPFDSFTNPRVTRNRAAKIMNYRQSKWRFSPKLLAGIWICRKRHVLHRHQPKNAARSPSLSNNEGAISHKRNDMNKRQDLVRSVYNRFQGALFPEVLCYQEQFVSKNNSSQRIEHHETNKQQSYTLLKPATTRKPSSFTHAPLVLHIHPHTLPTSCLTPIPHSYDPDSKGFPYPKRLFSNLKKCVSLLPASPSSSARWAFVRWSQKRVGVRLFKADGMARNALAVE